MSEFDALTPEGADRPHRPVSRLRRSWAGFVLAAGLAAIPVSTPAAAVTGPVAEVQLSIGESALFDLLRAVTPYTVTVDTSLAAIDLILSDPADLILRDGRASFRIAVRGATVPIDQVLEPELTVVYDAQKRQYLIVVSRLALELPLVGTLDIRNALPPLTVPALIQEIWKLEDRPIGTRFHVRRIAIVDHRLEIGADVEFPPVRSP